MIRVLEAQAHEPIKTQHNVIIRLINAQLIKGNSFAFLHLFEFYYYSLNTRLT